MYAFLRVDVGGDGSAYGVASAANVVHPAAATTAVSTEFWKITRDNTRHGRPR